MSDNCAKLVSKIGAEQEIKILIEISKSVQELDASPDSMEKVLKSLGKMIDYRSASIYLLPEGNRALEEICTVGRKVDLIDFVSFDLGSGISAWVAKHKRPIILNNLRKSRGGTHTKSFLSVPMAFENRIIGVINLAHDEPDSYSRRDAEIVSLAASIIALLTEQISHSRATAAKSKEIESLAEELGAIKQKLADTEKKNSAGKSSTEIARNICNPISIIAGNAQFLLSNAKNLTPSLTKRLQAIDKEARSILSMVDLHVRPFGEIDNNLILAPSMNRKPETGQRIFHQN